MSQIDSNTVVLNSVEHLNSVESIDQSSHISKRNDTRWEKVLANAFRDPIKLLEYLELDTNENLQKIQLDSKFKMLVPISYTNKMKKGDWQDPLLRQVLPLKDEEIHKEGYVSDPVGDLQAEVSPGVLHKYQGRILLVTTGACPVHCRYCFRREFPYVDSIPDKKHWQDTLLKVEQDTSIQEVIFSGGDPLMLSDSRLKKMCTDIASIPHVTTIRFHTRVPIFLPERITSDFLSWLGELHVNKVMVIHCNHENELTQEVGDVLLALRNQGVTLLNQAVLLRGVNDSTDILKPLLQRLFSFQVLPYYLHQLDKVQGSAHFEVDRNKALDLIEDLKIELPGYLIPRLVEELSGKRSKQSIVKIDK